MSNTMFLYYVKYINKTSHLIMKTKINFDRYLKESTLVNSSS